MRRKTGCSLIEWEPVDTGSCHVKYTIQYENQTSIIGAVTGIDDATQAWCTRLYSDAKTIMMWAVYNGITGNKSSRIPITDNADNCAILPG